jgi:hypothetical protein
LLWQAGFDFSRLDQVSEPSSVEESPIADHDVWA